MPTITLPPIEITTKQAQLLQRWFPKWNAGLTTPYASFEDACIGILKESIKNFVAEENLIRLPEIPDALRTAPDNVQDQVLDLLAPYLP